MIMKVVGVIGAGAAGLCAARHISATPGLTPVVWEKAARVGGTWVYTPQVGKDEHGLPIFSSMYKNLKTNLPKEVMQFPDFPFPAQEESFLHHTDVLSYLEDYARHYNLHQYIKFGCHVEQVKPVEQGEEPTTWSVTVRDLETSTTTTTVCDAVLVCNGHYSAPKTPSIKDIEKFCGRQIHSHDYREPEPFKGLRVVMLGAGASGLDISLEVATVAKEVILSHNQPIQIPSELPVNIRQTRGIVAAYESGFIFGDGSRAEADVLLYCTGYEYTFPFLSEECEVTVEDNVVKPLYKHLINIAHPTMAFVGIPFKIVPFPLFDFQVQYFIKTIKQGIVLPDKTTMEQSTQAALAEHCNKSQALKHFHRLEGNQWNYNNDLAALTSIPPVPQSSVDLYDFVAFYRKTQLMYYKNMQFKVRFFLVVLTGDATAVTSQAMDTESTGALQHLRRSDGHARHYHRLGIEGTRDYLNELASLAHIPPLAPHYFWIFKVVLVRFIFSYPTYKQQRYSLEAGGRVREWRGGREVHTTWELVWLVVRRSVYLLWQDFPRFFLFASKMLRRRLGLR